MLSAALPQPISSEPDVVIREVSLRDGLQSIPSIVDTDTKVMWLRSAYEAGLRDIEVGSFVPARHLPQMADTEQVVAIAKTLAGLRVSALVPNLKGAIRALDAGVDLIIVPVSASNAHSLANLRKSPKAMVEELALIRQERDRRGSKTLINGGIGTAFGCTLQGHVEERDVSDLLRALLDAGADLVSLADTVGYANPLSISRRVQQALEIAGDRFRGLHLHDTRGLGLVNAYTAYCLGVRQFDGCLAGIGGCPHAPGASGNVSTEDLAFMFETMNASTGIDIPALLKLRARIVQWLDGAPTYGSLWRAGLPKTMSTDRQQPISTEQTHA